MTDKTIGELANMKMQRNNDMRAAEKSAYEYACQCPVGDERIKAFEIYENIRNAGRVYL